MNTITASVKVSWFIEALSLKPDLAANKKNDTFITKKDSKIVGMVIPTNEELMIERDVVRIAGLK